MFNRYIGIKSDKIYSEGLHFRIPWFEFPIIYDIRAQLKLIKVATGSKGDIKKISA